ncbi:MAG: thiamine phosphate synthase [Parerythrobacter sp.]
MPVKPPAPVLNALKALPRIFLFSDARNDGSLEDVLARLPQDAALVFRHYHLDPNAKRARFDALASVARRFGHAVILSGTAETTKEWGADSVYGPVARLGEANGMIRYATVHCRAEAEAAIAARVDAAFVSPVHPTRSHTDAAPLGPSGYHALATLLERGNVRAIALGGMTAQRAAALPALRWGAIDGLVHGLIP